MPGPISKQYQRFKHQGFGVQDDEDDQDDQIDISILISVRVGIIEHYCMRLQPCRDLKLSTFLLIRQGSEI